MVDKKTTSHHSPPASKHSRLISLGVISGAHGIRGQVKIKSFTANPEDISCYGPLLDSSGKQYQLTITGGTNDALIATVGGVTDRNAAEALRNTELFVPRSALPEAGKHEYYHEDLVGLKLLTQDGRPYGTIAAMHNFGAGDLVAIKRESGEEEFLPFTRAIFQEIDIKEGRVVIAPPEIVTSGTPGDDND
jgi:16S rRNA processing protein RimM